MLYIFEKMAENKIHVKKYFFRGGMLFCQGKAMDIYFQCLV